MRPRKISPRHLCITRPRRLSCPGAVRPSCFCRGCISFYLRACPRPRGAPRKIKASFVQRRRAIAFRPGGRAAPRNFCSGALKLPGCLIFRKFRGRRARGRPRPRNSGLLKRYIRGAKLMSRPGRASPGGRAIAAGLLCRRRRRLCVKAFIEEKNFP